MVGIGSCVIYVPFVSVTSRWFQERRGMITGVLVSSLAIGMIIQPVAGMLILDLGWRGAYIVIGAIICIIALLAGATLKFPPQKVVEQNHASTNSSNMMSHDVENAAQLGLSEIIKNKSVWILFFTYVAFSFCMFLVSSHIVVHAIDLNIPATTAVYLLTVIGIASILGNTSVGALSDRLGRKSTIIGSLMLMGIVLACFPMAKDSAHLFTVAAVFGFAYGGYIPLIPTIIGEFFGLKNQGSILGFVLLGASLGASIGPVLAGYIFDISNSYNMAFWLAAVLALAAALASQRLRKPEQG